MSSLLCANCTNDLLVRKKNVQPAFLESKCGTGKLGRGNMHKLKHELAVCMSYMSCFIPEFCHVHDHYGCFK